jgi:hypothetical protein
MCTSSLNERRSNNRYVLELVVQFYLLVIRKITDFQSSGKNIEFLGLWISKQRRMFCGGEDMTNWVVIQMNGNVSS